MGSALTGMVDNENGAAVYALKTSQEIKNRSYFTSNVFIDPMKPYEGIKDQQYWSMGSNRKRQPFTVLIRIQP